MNESLALSQTQTSNGDANGSVNLPASNLADSGDKTSERTVIKSESLDENNFIDGYQICNYCQLMFPTLEELKTHIDSSHFSTEDLSCETCGKKFRSMFNLHAHVQTIHSNSQSVQCACGKTFQYRMALAKHEKRCPAVKGNGEIEQGTDESVNSKTGVEMESSDTINSKPEVGFETLDGTSLDNNLETKQDHITKTENS